MALTAQQRTTIIQAFRLWSQANAPSPEQQLTVLLQLLFQARAQQVAKLREWLAFVKDANTAQRDGLPAYVVDQTAALDQSIGQIDAADTELAGGGA